MKSSHLRAALKLQLSKLPLETEALNHLEEQDIVNQDQLRGTEVQSEDK